MFALNIILSIIVPVSLVAAIAIIGEQRSGRRISARNMKFEAGAAK